MELQNDAFVVKPEISVQPSGSTKSLSSYLRSKKISIPAIMFSLWFFPSFIYLLLQVRNGNFHQNRATVMRRFYWLSGFLLILFIVGIAVKKHKYANFYSNLMQDENTMTIVQEEGEYTNRYKFIFKDGTYQGCYANRRWTGTDNLANMVSYNGMSSDYDFAFQTNEFEMQDGNETKYVTDGMTVNVTNGSLGLLGYWQIFYYFFFNNLNPKPNDDGSYEGEIVENMWVMDDEASKWSTTGIKMQKSSSSSDVKISFLKDPFNENNPESSDKNNPSTFNGVDSVSHDAVQAAVDNVEPKSLDNNFEPENSESTVIPSGDEVQQGISQQASSENSPSEVAGQNGAAVNKDDDEKSISENVDIEASVNPAQWRRHLESQLQRYNEDAAANGMGPGTYTVQVKFLVEIDGSIADVHALNDPGFNLGKAAENIVENGPGWNPGIENGKQVRSYHTQPISFVITER